MKNQYLHVGQIVKTQGLKGELRVFHYCDNAESFINIKKFYLDKNGTHIDVTSKKIHGNIILIKIKDILTIDDAMKFVNKDLYCDRDEFTLPNGSYFIEDLIGIEVFNNTTKEKYGVIVDVTKTGANDVYHVKFTNGVTRYLPAIPQVVDVTDIDNNAMFITPLEGLFDD